MDSGTASLFAAAIAGVAVAAPVAWCVRARRSSGVSPGDGLLSVKAGRIGKADAAFAALAGAPARSWRGKAFPEAVFSPETAPTADDSERRASEAPYRATLKDGGRHVLVLPRNAGGRRSLVVRDITAARETETALRTAETRYRDLFDGMLEAIIIHRDGEIIDVNAAFTALCGYERHEVLGRNGVTLTFPEDVRDEVRARIVSRDFTPYETRIGTREGRELRVQISPREIVRDGVVYRAATMRDITSRKQAEAGLARQLSLYRATLEASLEGILAVSRSGRVDSYNRRFLEMWGLDTPGEDDERLLAQVTRKVADPVAFLARVKALYANPDEESDDLIELRDGRLFERHSRSQTLDGRSVGRVWTFRDVTERERARRAMRRQLALLDATLEATQEGLLVTDPSGRAVRCNRLLVRMWGLPERFPEGDSATMPVENPELVLSRTPPAEDDPEGREIIVLRDGRTLERTTKSLVTEEPEAGRVTGYRDVTVRANETAMLRHSTDELERRVDERTEELARTNETLRASNAELEAFSFSVSHDLRAPLRAIDTLTQALAEDCGGALDGAAADYLSRIRSGVRRMSRIMDDLIHLSRANRVEMKREPVDLSALAKSVDATLRREFPERAVVFDCPEQAEAFADKRLIRVVLENLIGNAWKYSSKKPAAVILFGFEDRPDGTREFHLRDNGAGFDGAFKHKLFKTFSRLHAPQEFEGTGLGLAIVARIVARHGGTIAGDSKPGEGAVFTFTLPRG